MLLESDQIYFINSSTYTYADGVNGSSTNLIESESSGVYSRYYSYDAVGNITSISLDSLHENGVTYVYDSLGQLVRENDTVRNITVVYAYDGNGNITSVSEYAYTTGDLTAVTPTKVTSYTYGDANWGDLLTSYDGQTITYDAIGNPLSYLGATLTWTNGRRLASYTKGDTAVTYTYNADGMRTSKTVNGVTTDYVYDGSTLLAQKTGDNWMYFIQSPRGVIGFDYNGTNYYYVQNVQGDVVAVMSEQGSLVCRYTYDSWGKLITVTDANGDSITDSTHIALLNPIRYRGYLYDSETALYYLQSRYYNPEVKRFVNGDGLLNHNNIVGYNLFAYCFNNPINMIDINGEEAISISTLFIVGIAVTLIVVALASVVNTPSFQKDWTRMCNGIANIFTGTLRWAANQAKSIARSIGNSFAKAKTKTKYRSDHEIHHIVAKKAPNAEHARRVLKAVGIDVNSCENLIRIKTGLHRRLHTNLYYGWANSVVISAYNKGRNIVEKRSYVLLALNRIRSMIRNMDAVAPY